MNALYDLSPFTLLDFPGLPAAIFWFAGCNLRCVYCYNPDIVLGEARIDEESALNFLKSRRGLLEGVVLSGGEATLYPEIVSFAQAIKALEYKIKLDTNAMRPDVIRQLMSEGLLDYVALDYKAPADELAKICGGGSAKRFWESFDLLVNGSIDFEIRTTFHPDLMHEDQIIAMAMELKQAGYQKPFYVQMFREGSDTLGDIAASQRVVDRASLEAHVTLRR